MRILLIEDEKGIADFVASSLRTDRFAVDWAATAEKGLLLAKVNPYDAGIFDIRLSDRLPQDSISKTSLNQLGDSYSGIRECGREGLGTGLGLYICRQIVEAHGGTITAESKFGEGSCFIIHLPFTPHHYKESVIP